MADYSGFLKNREIRDRIVRNVQTNIQETGKLAQQMLRGSRSQDILMQTTKHFVHQESSIVSTHEKVKNVGRVITNMDSQFTDISKSFNLLSQLNNQLDQVWR